MSNKENSECQKSSPTGGSAVSKSTPGEQPSVSNPHPLPDPPSQGHNIDRCITKDETYIHSFNFKYKWSTSKMSTFSLTSYKAQSQLFTYAGWTVNRWTDLRRWKDVLNLSTNRTHPKASPKQGPRSKFEIGGGGGAKYTFSLHSL